MTYPPEHFTSLPIEQYAQIALLEELYPKFSVQVNDKQDIIVDFTVEDVYLRDRYHINIVYTSPWIHKVFIKKPAILPFFDIHMYMDGSLCLYYPFDISPFDRVTLALHLVRWTYRWIFSFELWKTNGYIWPHDYVPHSMHLLTSYVPSEMVGYSSLDPPRRALVSI